MTFRVAAIACAATGIVAALAGSLLVGGSSASPTAIRAVPILMYHVVTAPPPGATYPELFVSRSEFGQQMRWLAAHGYRAVTLRQVYDSWKGTGRLPQHPFVVTFDDGHRSVHTNALPVLRTHGWPGVLNLTLRNIGSPGGLSPWKVRQLLATDWELASHSLTHPDLTRLAAKELQNEVLGSRRVLQRRFRVAVDFFCYPSGRYDGKVIAAVKSAGYLGATTTRRGLARAREPFALARVRVNAHDTGADLGAELRALGA